MKKFITIMLSVMLCIGCMFTLSACNDGAKYTVGICQLTQHPALDAATQGFKDALKKELGDDVKIEENNASGVTDTITSIINGYVNKNVDLIMANATPVLQNAVNATSTIPILGTSVTDYADALSIKDFNGSTGFNVSGTSDLAPLSDQANQVKELYPDAKKVGLIYCSAEANSKFQVENIKVELEKLGYTCKEFSFADSNDVAAVCTAAASESDVLYIPTDNTAASCTETINGVIGNTPVIAGEEGICQGCGLATLSINYYDLGYKTGLMAVKILRDGEDVSKMPIEYIPVTKKYNKTKCAQLGLTDEFFTSKGYVAIGE